MPKQRPHLRAVRARITTVANGSYNAQVYATGGELKPVEDDYNRPVNFPSREEAEAHVIGIVESLCDIYGFKPSVEYAVTYSFSEEGETCPQVQPTSGTP